MINKPASSSLRTSLLSVNSVDSTPRPSTASDENPAVQQTTSIPGLNRIRSAAMRHYWFAFSISLFFVIGKLLSAAGLLLFTLINTFFALGWIKDNSIPTNISFPSFIIQFGIVINLITNLLNRTSPIFAAFLPIEYYTTDRIDHFKGQIRTGEHLLSVKKMLITLDEYNKISLYEIIGPSARKIPLDSESEEQALIETFYSATTAATLANITHQISDENDALLSKKIQEKVKIATSLSSSTARVCFLILRVGLTGALFYSTSVAFLSGITLVDNCTKMLGISVQPIAKWITVGWITSAALVGSLTFNLPYNIENALKFCRSIDNKIINGNANLSKKSMALTIISCTYAVISSLCWAYFQSKHAMRSLPILKESTLACEILNIICIYTSSCINFIGFGIAAKKMYDAYFSSTSQDKMVARDLNKWEIFARIIATLDALCSSAGSFTGSHKEYKDFLGDQLDAWPGQVFLSADIAIIVFLLTALYREQCYFVKRGEAITHDNKKEAKLPGAQGYVLLPNNKLQYINTGEKHPIICEYDLNNEKIERIQHYPEILTQKHQNELKILIKEIETNPEKQHFYQREYLYHQYAAILAGIGVLVPTLVILNHGTKQQRARLVLAESLINYISTAILNTGFNQQGIKPGVTTLTYLSSCASTCFSSSRGHETSNENHLLPV